MDDNKVDVRNYLKADETNKMTRDLNMHYNHRIKHLRDEPQSGTGAVNKNYVDSVVPHSHVKPSHQKDEFAFLMSNVLEWTDLLGSSCNLTKIADLSPTNGNFHTYNHKVIYNTLYKNQQDGFKYKMGINCYTLQLNVDYTLCIEIMNINYNLWNNTKVSIDRTASQGLTIGNVLIKKFRHVFSNFQNNEQYMYYHRLIINFNETAESHPYFLHLLVDIPHLQSNLKVYPKSFSGTYIVAYGILGQVSDVDADKVYDYHTAFDIKPTEILLNVNINANQKTIRNIALDKYSDSSAATVGMVKEIIPFIKNNLYRKYFEEFYDFSDASNYKLTIGASGVTFTGVNPNLTFQTTKELSII